MNDLFDVDTALDTALDTATHTPVAAQAAAATAMDAGAFVAVANGGDGAPPAYAWGNVIDADGNALELALYARQAYLEYALSVVKGRALPTLADGQKPVQRRILYAMQRLGLGFGGGNDTNGARSVKSARVVGDVLGRFHPHGDQAAYDALVRMAQPFSQRYPLIDGQGNFGSRDGDNAAAMRYTEARLTRIATLLLNEIDEGTVDYVPNYDGSTDEPRLLPARLPMLLLNGASGIAVGMATEIPSHNLREVAAAALALLNKPDLSDSEFLHYLNAPDFAGGGHIINSPQELENIYTTGRGTLRMRARWTMEELARGQWQMVVSELPHNTNTQKVLQEIEELSNPRVKAGKKTLTPEQLQSKATLLAVLENVRDESNKDANVRLVLEPRSRSVSQQEFIDTLLSQTSLETSMAVNFTMIGLDGLPLQKNVRTILRDWLQYRQNTVLERSRYRLQKVQDRLHILQGRRTVLLHIDAVIHIIRTSDEPKAALIARFHLSQRQAEDILDLRLRQLARLESLRIDQEISALQDEERKLLDITSREQSLQKLMMQEIEADAKAFGDARRTLVHADKAASLQVRVIDEALTVIVSEKGWVRTIKGHECDPSLWSFKEGDALLAGFACRSVDMLLAFGRLGRVYSVPVSQLPGGRGDGQPFSSMVKLETGDSLQYYFAGPAQTQLLLAASNGYGFIARVEHMLSRNKAGKAFITLEGTDRLCPPVRTEGASERMVACLSSDQRLLGFAFSELRLMPSGGKGLQLIALDSNSTLQSVAVWHSKLTLHGTSHSGKERAEQLDKRSLQALVMKRGKRGKDIGASFKVLRLAGEV